MTEKTEITTQRMPGESLRNYLAWRLYCEAGSLDKTLVKWAEICEGKLADNSSKTRQRLGKVPTRRTLEKWCVQYSWVKRRDLYVQAEIEAMDSQLEEFRLKKKHMLTEILERMIKIKLDNLVAGSEKEVPARDLKAIWEIVQTELGESLGKTELEHKLTQRPIQPEEEVLEDSINNMIAEVLTNQKKEVSNGDN